MKNELPKFDDLMLPILKLFGDGENHTRREIKELIYSNFTQDELSILISSGKHGVIADRTSWALQYLRFAQLLINTSRGVYQISEDGKKLLNTNPEKITIAMLKKYPAFIEATAKTVESETGDTPIDSIDSIIAKQNIVLENQILECIMNKDPYFFEELVLELFKKMGYGNFETTSKSRDGGIDGIIYQDKLGVDRIYTQAKRNRKDNLVQTPEIDKFVGVLHQNTTRSTKGIFITTSDFTKTAREKAKADSMVNIVLINGHELVQLMIEYNMGVKSKEYSFKEIDEEFFFNEQF